MTTRTIAHVTDTHLGQRLVIGGDLAAGKTRYEDEPDAHKDQLRLVFDDVSRKGISHIVFGGDIGVRASVGSFFELLREYDFSSSIVLGNHDAYGVVTRYRGVGAGPVDGKMCSSHEERHLKHIVLDSSDDTIGDRQLAWLTRELDTASKVALYLHHPILAVDTPLERSGAALRDRDGIKTLLASADCEVTIFCGHYHMIDEAREGNIRQFVSPAVSYQIVKQSDQVRVDTSTFGYRILDIDDAEIRTQAVLLTKA